MLVRSDTDARLTYCLNVHQGDRRAAMEAALFRRAPAILRRVASEEGRSGPVGPGLWLGAEIARAYDDDRALASFSERLRAAGLAPFTANGFPMGAFHGEDGPVKRRVYRPTWAEPARAEHTLRLARVLAALPPAGGEGTISTLPLGYRKTFGADAFDRAAEAVAEVALALARVRDEQGVTVRLAIEPEPDCALERAGEVIAFFEEHLLRAGATRLAALDGARGHRAETLLRRHVGMCLDTVHEAVVGADPLESLAQCASAGVSVPKLQLGAALRCDWSQRRALEPWAEPVYLHQTRVSTAAGADWRFADLADALAADLPGGREAVVHFHVPLTWAGDGALSGTADLASPALLAAALRGGTRHFEVEVYTLGVLPGGARSDADQDDALAEELRWVLQRFDEIS